MSRVAPTPEDEAQLFHECAKAGMLPLVSPCPNGCRFCYEREMHRLYPGVRVPRVPAPTGQRLERFWADVAEAPQPVQAGTALSVKDGAVQYYNWSDFFSQGLGLEEIEGLLRHNAAFRYTTWVHTNARDLPLEWVERLSSRFPETLRLHLSVTTLDERLKRTLVAGWDATQRLLQIIRVVRHAKLYLIHVTAEQTLADLRLIDAYANRSAPPVVVIARLHHHRLHAADIRELSLEAGRQERRAVELLVQHRDELENIEDVFLFFPSAGYAWTARAYLRGQLRPYGLGPSDLVVCSEGAEDVLRRFVVEGGARIVAVADPIGGSTDFITTVTTRGLLETVRAQLALDPALRRLFVPASLWWIEDRYCLDGGTADELRAELPALEVVVVPIPLAQRRRRLTLEEAQDFLGVDLARTAELWADEAARATLGRACCTALEEVTSAGYVRHVALDVRALGPDEREACSRALPPGAWRWGEERSELVLDARRLDEIDESAWGERSLGVTYLEPVFVVLEGGVTLERRAAGREGQPADVRRDRVFQVDLRTAEDRRSFALLLRCDWDTGSVQRRLAGLAPRPAPEEVERLLGRAEALQRRCAHVERTNVLR